jgi:hypothetical protein
VRFYAAKKPSSTFVKTSNEPATVQHLEKDLETEYVSPQAKAKTKNLVTQALTKLKTLQPKPTIQAPSIPTPSKETL